MCAGVYLDQAFRDQLLREIYNDRTRRVAPSYGYDLIVVLHDAWRAWWLESVQHAAVLAVLATALVRAPAEAVIALSALAICYFLRCLAGWAAGVAAYYRGRWAEPEIRRLMTRGKLFGGGLLASVVVLVAAMVTAYGRLDGGGTWPVRYGLRGAAIILAASGGIVAASTAARMTRLGRLRDKDPRRRRKLGRRLRVIDTQQHHPFTVHSGFKPFIGSGASVRSWSFAQRLVHLKTLGTEPDQEFVLPPFTTYELVDRLRDKISELRDVEHAETRLPGLVVADQVFVEGTQAGPFHDVLLDRAESRRVQDAIAAAITRPDDVARHYLACRVVSWGGEVVTTVFVHVSLQGRTLYLEFSTHALLPTRAEYHIIDEPHGTGPVATARAIGKALLRLPAELLAVRRLPRAPVQLWAALRPRQDLTFRTRAWYRADIGATLSAREAAAGDTDESYFQFQDILQHSKIIERRLIATVGDYLKDLGVDTSEFWERARAILNTGVINAGSGTVNITGSAIGDQASVVNETPLPET